MKATQQDKFTYFIPLTLEKSGELGEMKISGICSTIAEDSDGEFLDPTGFDYTPLLQTGFFNWNHQAGKSAGAVLGRPTKAEVTPDGKQFYVEGFLYKGVEEARRVYDLAKTLQEEDPERQLGFSIEGQATERDMFNPKKVKKARITGIAITHCPKNPNTLLQIMKGEYSEPIQEAEELSSKEVANGGEISRWERLVNRRWEEACCDNEFVDYCIQKGICISIDDPNVLMKDKEEALREKNYLGKAITTADIPQVESVDGGQDKIHPINEQGQLKEGLDRLTSNEHNPGEIKPFVMKSWSESFGEEVIEKGGEGSRGGKVIGHTRSGLPVYEEHYSMNNKGNSGTRVIGKTRSGKDVHMSNGEGQFSADKHFGHFTKEDHQDAIDLHTYWYGKHLKDEGERGVSQDDSKKHINLAHKHEDEIDYHQDKVDTFRKSEENQPLTKSQVYQQIFDKYGYENATRIYEFVVKTNSLIHKTK